MGMILLVDDDPGVLFTLSEIVEARGHAFIAASSAADALAHAMQADVVVTDFAMPDKDGMVLLRELHELSPSLPVILLTAHGSERVAVQAMKEGAYDYLAKPVDNEEMLLTVERAMEMRHLRAQTQQHAIEEAVGVRIVGSSPAMVRAFDRAERLAAKDVTVLIRGETGTGKELFATLLHARSHRRDHPLIRFNCAAIPPDLAEAQLFGHTKGAFTGANAAHTGFFLQAQGGTIVLDEVAELPLALQAKLLRVLQEREVKPIGSTRIEKVDVRVIASTHRDLATEVREGRFREDLYYRLAVVDLVVPPLRERLDDLPLLVREFAKKYSERFDLGHVVQFAPELLDLFARSAWPCNVRQLENIVARCVALATEPVVGPGAFAMESGNLEPHVDHDLSLKDQLEAFERSILSSALSRAGGNQSEVSRRLGVTRASLYDRIKKYGLQASRRSS
ncbi:sigma-54 dependent transcriptional regulator [soil metagenome]